MAFNIKFIQIAIRLSFCSNLAAGCIYFTFYFYRAYFFIIKSEFFSSCIKFNNLFTERVF